MEIKKIQEILNEYSVELKSADQHITTYVCKKVGEKNKLKVSAKQLDTFCNTNHRSNFALND
jgi:hypothetical protein